MPQATIWLRHACEHVSASARFEHPGNFSNASLGQPQTTSKQGIYGAFVQHYIKTCIGIHQSSYVSDHEFMLHKIELSGDISNDDRGYVKMNDIFKAVPPHCFDDLRVATANVKNAVS